MIKHDYSTRLPGATLDVHRSDLYHPPRPDEDRQVNEAVSARAGAWPTSGDRRLPAMLRRQGLKGNAQRVRRLMHAPGIGGEAPTRAPRTTARSHPSPRFPNGVEGLKAERPEPVWVADITSIRLRKEFVYLSVLMDVFTRRIRGGRLGRSLGQVRALTAWERAFERGRPEIHHSDQGVRSAATASVDLRKGRGVKIRMASVGEPEEKGSAERLMRTIKEEEVDHSEYEDIGAAMRGLGRFLDDVSNRKRIPSALGSLTPAEFEQQWISIQRSQGSVATSVQ